MKKLQFDKKDKCKDCNEVMTLGDAIEHLKEIIPTIECEECKKQHIQLLDWLEELRELRTAQDLYME